MKLRQKLYGIITRCSTNLFKLIMLQLFRFSYFEDCQKERKKYSITRKYNSSIHYSIYFIWITIIHTAHGQVELGYSDLLYPNIQMYAATKQVFVTEDPLQQMRAMTTRATITVEGRDQNRHLTVFRASKHGHVEFGFPIASRRASGSLEIFDATRMSSSCCPPGIRMVAVRHGCSGAFMTLDSHRQLRACQLTDNGQVTPLRKHTHCLDGEKMHICAESPYFYLDSRANFHVAESSTSDHGRQYVLRFEKQTTPQSQTKQVSYAYVTSTTWLIKLRTQNSILRKATADAAKKLWERSLYLLFRRSVATYKLRRKKRNFLGGKAICEIEPIMVRNFLAKNVTLAQFRQAVESSWRPATEVLATSMAWSRMGETEKNLFVSVAAKVVHGFMRSSFMAITKMECLQNSQWGRLSLQSRLQLLERSLTIGWLHRITESRRLVISSIERTFQSKVTSFLIKEEG